ncbi:MAG: hypothetical protein WCK05_05090 [Planctomycetota bacterium]
MSRRWNSNWRSRASRKVTEVMEKLCGKEVRSTDVSRATKLLDEDRTAI